MILCGGMSRRMGRPKALLPFGDEVLLQRMVRILSPIAAPIVVVSAPGQELPDLPEEVRIVRDAVAGQGPLRGLASGLRALGDESNDLVFATSTDAPFLKPEWIGRLLEHALYADLVIAEIDGYLHSLSALYRRSTVLPVMERLLAEERFRLGALREEVRAVVLGASAFNDIDPDLETLQNINTPEDYARALARWETKPGRDR